MSAEDEQQFMVDGRPVSDLKVVDLRKELEIRSLPKSGNKKELVDRLLNFLREEQEELIKQQQQIPQEVVQENKQQTSPSATTPSVLPDMVSQYLVQQQIQLEAARRDADKARASSSYDSIPAEMVQQTEQQLTGIEVTEKFKSMLQEQERDLNEIVPEEPSSSGQEHVQSTELHSQQTETVEEVQDDSQQEVNSNENGESEDDNKAQRSEESSVTEEGYADIGGGDDEDTTPAAEENSIQIGEANPQEAEEKDVGEEHSEPQIIEEVQSQQSFTNENIEADCENIAEFVPDEPEHKKAKIETDNEKSVERYSVKDEESDAEVGSQKENSEYDEDERENIDDSGKRRRDINEGDFEETKGIDDNEKEGSDKNVEEYVPQPIVVTASQQISSTLERRRVSSTLTGVQMLSSSKPPIEIQQKEYEEITPEGFVRKRAASPARNHPSRWIHIRGLKRPYTQRALLELLGKFGIVDEGEFWIDSIKSNCIVTYDTIEQAELARERLHNVIWPTASTESLCVEFSTEDKLKRRQSEEQNGSNSRLRLSDTLQPLPETGGRGGGGLGGLTIVVDNRCPISPSGAQVHIQHEKEQQKEAEIRKRKAEELEQSQEKLNQIFKKTKTQPSLYYLPLSDDEVAKRQAIKKQSSSKNNSSTNDRVRDHRRDENHHHDSHYHRSSHYSYHHRSSGDGNNDRRRTTTTTSGNRR